MLENEEKIPLQLFTFQIDIDASTQLKKGAGWAKFFGITGLILAVIALFSEFASLYALTRFYGVENDLNQNGLGSFKLFLTMFISIVSTIVFLISCIYLVKYSSQIAKSVEYEDSNLLAKAFQNLKVTLILWSITLSVLLAVGVISAIRSF
jgi:hypothetical protein